MYKVEYIRWDTPEQEVDRLIKEHGLDKKYVKLTQADYKTTMVISAECALSSYYTDNGEPEDATFNRDWSWVKTELERAYELGKRDAYAELSKRSEAATGSRSEEQRSPQAAPQKGV